MATCSLHHSNIQILVKLL